jgi:hypothetical protein
MAGSCRSLCREANVSETVQRCAGLRARSDNDAGARTVEVLQGECLLIPEGAWHRAEIVVSATLLFVPPSPALTQHRDLTPGGPG